MRRAPWGLWSFWLLLLGAQLFGIWLNAHAGYADKTFFVACLAVAFALTTGVSVGMHLGRRLVSRSE